MSDLLGFMLDRAALREAAFDPKQHPRDVAGRFKPKLVDVEDGFARVANEAGAVIGHVSREKYGSTRTGTRWRAHSAAKFLGHGYTRNDAVQLVVDRHLQVRARNAERDRLRAGRAKS